eukprot:3153768-Rhodomonas_salina.2
MASTVVSMSGEMALPAQGGSLGTLGRNLLSTKVAPKRDKDMRPWEFRPSTLHSQNYYCK